MARGLPLGGCMDIPATMVSANNLVLLSRAKASKSTVTTEPYLLTRLALSPSGRSLSMDLHTAAGPCLYGQLTSIAPL